MYFFTFISKLRGCTNRSTRFFEVRLSYTIFLFFPQIQTQLYNIHLFDYQTFFSKINI